MVSGIVSEPIVTPTQFGMKVFKNNLVKLVSGSHHTLRLTKNGKVYAWGDAEVGKIGRLILGRARNRHEAAMKI